MLSRVVFVLFSLLSLQANANLIMSTSPTSAGALPFEIPTFGGAVVDIVTNEGDRVTSYISAKDLFRGYLNTGRTDYDSIEIGSLVYSPSTLNLLTTGIAELAIRFSLYDGDNAVGIDVIEKDEYQANDNSLLVNSNNFGNFSFVDTVTTDRNGSVVYDNFGADGFANKMTGTGWFYSNDTSLLGLITDSLLQTSTLTFDMIVVNSRNENWLTFQETLDNKNVPPSITVTNVSEPMVALLMLLTGAVFFTRRKRNQI